MSLSTYLVELRRHESWVLGLLLFCFTAISLGPQIACQIANTLYVFNEWKHKCVYDWHTIIAHIYGGLQRDFDIHFPHLNVQYSCELRVRGWNFVPILPLSTEAQKGWWVFPWLQGWWVEELLLSEDCTGKIPPLLLRLGYPFSHWELGVCFFRYLKQKNFLRFPQEDEMG